MRLTFEDRLKMCEDHVLRGKSLRISEENGNYDIPQTWKYLINLYKKFGSEVFLNQGRRRLLQRYQTFSDFGEFKQGKNRFQVSHSI